jgi:3-phenylpropionate/trans-cinnamate dioxygenase ferredoxin reductase subunit
MSAGIVVLGAGQAGFQLAVSLREGGYADPITLVGEEAEPPYQRPPLSKVFLKGGEGPESLSFRPPSFFERHGIALSLNTRALRIDREAARVLTEPGGWLDYDRLVLATGARNRPLALPGAALENVVSLRGAEDGLALRAALARSRRVVIIGGGFLGLEVASSARAMGAEVTVIEAGERLMGRAVSPAVSRHFLEYHRSRGVAVELGQTISAILGETRAEGVTTTENRDIPADLVVVAVGVVPNTEIAEAAGLAVDRGIIVDHALRTSDPRIHAIGDCARFPSAHGGGLTRLESVQNAVDQARCAAADILGKPQPYEAVPWFWSDQGERLQIAGLTADAEEMVTQGGPEAFSVYCFRDGVLIGAESVNRPADHVKARRMLAAAERPLRAAFAS